MGGSSGSAAGSGDAALEQVLEAGSQGGLWPLGRGLSLPPPPSFLPLAGVDARVDALVEVDDLLAPSSSLFSDGIRRTTFVLQTTHLSSSVSLIIWNIEYACRGVKLLAVSSILSTSMASSFVSPTRSAVSSSANKSLP